MKPSLLAAIALLTTLAPAAAHCAPKPREKNLALRLGVTEDLAFIGGQDVCTKQSQLDDGFSCFRSSGSQYHGTPFVGQADKINGGVAPATTRLTLGADFALASWIALGAEGGLVLLGAGPTPDGGKKFLPVHGAARALFFPGADARDHDGFAAYVLLSAGVRQIDAKQSVKVVEDPSAPPPPNQPDNPPTQSLDAYKKMGSGFAGLGAGARLALGSGFDAAAELNLLQLLPSSGTALSLLLAVQVAL